MPIEHDLLLMPQPDGLADLPDARPKGLLEQLLEDGAVYRELVMPGATFQVKTTARFDASDVCFFRCVVSRQGDELTEAPWAPIFCNLTEEMAASEAGSETRLALARRALEVHLSLCHRVERQLEAKGDLAPPSVLQTRVPWPYGAAILSVVVVASAWYGLERWRLRLPGPPISSRSEAPAPPITSLAEVVADPRAEEDARAPIPGASPAPGQDSASNRSAAADRAEPVAAAPARRPPRPRQRSEPSARSPRTVKPQPTEPQPVRPSPSARAQVTAEAVDQPPSPVPRTRVDTTPTMPTLIAEVVPGDHRLLRLEPGVRVYADADIRISDIPRAYRQLPCVTTVSSDGGTEQGLLLQLKRAAKVFVAHDPRVKKRPEWLASFRPTGDTLRALEVDKGRTLEFAIYHLDVAAGAVALGSNTRTKALTRKVREFVPRKNRVMYLVCLAEANGQVPSP